jgi:hypothetical protein
MRILLAALLAVLTLRQAAAERPTISAESSVFSQYVWRGMLLTNGPVLQNSVTTLWRGAHLNIWTNQDLNSVDGRRGKFNEVDFDAGYDRSLKKAVISAGAIRYAFPNTPTAATTELYAGAALAVPMQPAVKAFFDVAGTRVTYLTFDISHAVPLPQLSESVGWSVELAGGAGWGSSGYNLAWFGIKEPGWVDFHPSMAVLVRFGKHWRLTPRLSYAALARNVLRQSGVSFPHNFVAGLAFGFTR